MITVENLTKKYNGKTVVQDLSFTAPDGLVTGFLGPNGSGKSTTMRCMLGLDTPNDGQTLFDGKYFPDQDNKSSIAGALLDSNWFLPGQTALGHLKSVAASCSLPAQRAQECLDQVGLTSVADKRIKQFSLGMKQRLGLAAALLGSPKNLILDEPVNGLDPEGVHWMRSVIRSYAQQGGAVLISSHLLSEMQLTADRLVVIGQGKFLGEYTMADFLSNAQGTGADSAISFDLRVADSSETSEVLTAKGYNLTLDGDHLIAQSNAGGQGATELEQSTALAQILADNNILVTHLSARQVGLEQRYLEMTQNYQEYTTQGIEGVK